MCCYRKNWQPPIVTLDAGVGRVFRQIKDGIPPDSAFLFPTLVSIRETRWEWHGHGRALVSASGLCLPSPPTHPFVRAAPASAGQSPPVDKPHSSCSLPLLLLFSGSSSFLPHPSSKAQLLYASSVGLPSETSPQH